MTTAVATRAQQQQRLLVNRIEAVEKPEEVREVLLKNEENKNEEKQDRVTDTVVDLWAVVRWAVASVCKRAVLLHSPLQAL
jgi:hypothetical protein